MKRFRRRPAPVHTGVEPELVTTCYFHGPENINDDTYRICGECGHAYTADELVTQHNAVLEGLGNPWHVSPRRVDSIGICPLCTHDF